MAARQLVVGDVFRDAARAAPDRMATALGDAQLTFSEVQTRADRVRGALRSSWSAGDRVAVWSDTDLRLVPLFAAAAQAGAVFIPIAPHLTPSEAAAVLEVARTRVLIVDDGRAAGAKELEGRLGIDIVPLEALDGDAAARTAPVVSELDPHVVFFTSGTSGRPKGVVLSHRVNVLRSHPGAQFEPRGIAVCSFPLFHMAGWTIALQQWHAR